MAPIDWIVVAAYLAVVAWLGTRLARRQTDTEAYFIGGRAIPWWAVGCSFFGTSISTATFIALPGQAYGGDWRPHLGNLMFPLAAIFIALVVIPFYRQRVRMSAYEFLEERFGYGARCYTSCFYLISRLFRSGLVLFLMAKAIGAMTGWSPFTIVLVAGVIALVYTILGGLEAVIWTDVIQSVTLFGGGLFCLAMLWFGEDGSAQLLSVANESDKFRMVDWSLDLSQMTVLVTVAYGVFGFLSNYTVQQDAAQRYLASPSTREAQKAIWFGAIGCVVTWNLFMLIGSLLFSYYSLHPAELPAHIAASETEVFPWFVVTRIPAGMTGVILAGMCAAAMSSLDTMINSMAMVTVRDFYLHFRPKASDRSQLMLGRAASAFWGLLGLGVGLVLLLGVEQALQFSFTVFSILGGGLFGLFLLAFFVKRAHALGVYVGLACGVLISAWTLIDQALAWAGAELGLAWAAQLAETLRYPFHPWLTLFLANLVSFTVGWAASLILPDIRKRRHSA